MGSYCRVTHQSRRCHRELWTDRMGLDNFSYINMQDQHSPEYYHYSPPSVQGPASVPSIQELGNIKKELCAMNKQDFISRAPLFMGDILWAHLEILQRETDQDIKAVPVSSGSYYPP